MSLFTYSNEAELLSSLTTALAGIGVKLALELGADEDARREAPPRITLVPRRDGRKYTDPSQQKAAIKVGIEKNIAFDVHLWGRDYAEASRLEDAFLKVLYNGLSRNAYELLGGGPADAPATSTEQVGYELIVGVRFLRIPVAVENYSRVTLDTLTATGGVVGARGETPKSATVTLTISES